MALSPYFHVVRELRAADNRPLPLARNPNTIGGLGRWVTVWTHQAMSSKKNFNISLEYSYRLSVTHKIICRVILAGSAGSNDIASIKDRLEDGVYFVPGQVFLPDLRCAFDEKQRSWDRTIDHPWHELDKVNLTKLPPTDWFDRSAGEVVEAFLAVRWDDDYLSGPVKPLFQSHQVATDAEPGKPET